MSQRPHIRHSKYGRPFRAGRRVYRVFGKKSNESFGHFYNFLSTSAQGAASQARRKYKLKVLHVSRL